MFCWQARYSMFSQWLWNMYGHFFSQFWIRKASSNVASNSTEFWPMCKSVITIATVWDPELRWWMNFGVCNPAPVTINMDLADQRTFLPMIVVGRQVQLAVAAGRGGINNPFVWIWICAMYICTYKRQLSLANNYVHLILHGSRSHICWIRHSIHLVLLL